MVEYLPALGKLILYRKQGRNIGSDYFDELLTRILDIRASEKRFYQKIRDIYAWPWITTLGQKRPGCFSASFGTNCTLPFPAKPPPS